MKGTAFEDRVGYLVEALAPYYGRELEHRKRADTERWAVGDLLVKEQLDLDTPELFKAVETQLPWGSQTLLKRRRTAECWPLGDRKQSVPYGVHELLAVAQKLSQTKRRRILADSRKNAWGAARVRTEIAEALRPPKGIPGPGGNIGTRQRYSIVDERWPNELIWIRYTPTLNGAEIHVESTDHLGGGDLSLERNPS